MSSGLQGGVLCGGSLPTRSGLRDGCDSGEYLSLVMTGLVLQTFSKLVGDV